MELQPVQVAIISEQDDNFAYVCGQMDCESNRTVWPGELQFTYWMQIYTCTCTCYCIALGSNIIVVERMELEYSLKVYVCVFILLFRWYSS